MSAHLSETTSALERLDCELDEFNHSAAPVSLSDAIHLVELLDELIDVTRDGIDAGEQPDRPLLRRIDAKLEAAVQRTVDRVH